VAPVRVIPVGAGGGQSSAANRGRGVSYREASGQRVRKRHAGQREHVGCGVRQVNVSDVVALTEIVDGLKTFAIDGGACTLMLAEAVPPVPPSVEVTLPVVLFCVPAAIPVTFTENVQEDEAAMLWLRRG